MDRFLARISRRQRRGVVRKAPAPREKRKRLLEPRGVVNVKAGGCRSKMRMSGLCKVEMSGFIQSGRRDGTGANRVERERTGAVEGFAASRRGSSKTNRSGPASALDRPSGAAFAKPPASRRRRRDRTPAARAAVESQDPHA